MNDEMNPEVTTVRALAFEEVDRDWTEQLLMKRGGPRYGAAIEALLGGKSLFVAGMGKVELESLRASLRYRTDRTLRSTRANVNGVAGRRLLLEDKVESS